MRPLLFSTLVVVMCGCGVATRVRPTPKGVVEPEVSVGGPLVNAGAPIPLPLSALGASVGIHERVSLAAHLQLTPLLAFGVPGVDVGATALLLEQDGGRPSLCATLRGYVFTDFSTAAWPYAQASLVAGWRVGTRTTLFAGVDGMYAFVDRAFSWSPGAGVEIALSRWTLSAEARWYEPTYRPGATVVPWLAPAGAGSLGILLGARYAFGGAG